MSGAGEDDSESSAYPPRRRAWLALLVLTLAYIVSFIDRQAISLLVEPIKRDLQLSDMQLGLLQGFAFATVYVLAGLPLGRAADQFNRRNIILVGVAFWSVMTGLCGLVRHYGALLVCRAGVGIGEATLSPSAYSMLADYFPPKQLPAAMSIYTLGASFGSGLAFLLGGAILAFAGSAETLDLGLPLLRDIRPWQLTFVLLGTLGFVVIALLAFVHEPSRRLASLEAVQRASFAETGRFLRAHFLTIVPLLAGMGLLGLVSYATMTWYPTMIVRTFDESVSRTGMLLGPLMILGSIVGNLAGAWAAMQLAGRGYRAPYIRWVFLAAIAVSAWGVVTPLMPSLPSTMVMTAMFVVLQNTWTGPAMAALHVAAPNRVRGQLTALALLCMNLVGLSVGPTAVAALTQYVFGDPKALRYSLSIVSIAAGTAGAALLWLSSRNFERGAIPATSSAAPHA